MARQDIKAGSAYVELMLRDKKFFQRLTSAQGRLISFAAAVVSIGGVLRATRNIYDGFVGVAQTQIDAETKLAAVLKATKNAAGFTADELARVASELQAVTTVGDEATINMQAVLATFKNIQGNEFTRATKAALDMTAVLDTDLKSAAIQLGKALNDPEKGLSALSRSGVSFTAQQEEMVKAMVRAGDVAGAQNIILAEMEAQFGGAAEAAAKAAGGPLKQFWNVLGDIREIIGGAVLSVLDAFATKGKVVLETWGPILRGIAAFIKQNASFIAAVTATAAAIALAGSATVGLGVAAQVAAVGFAGVLGLLSAMLSPLGLATAAVAGLATWFTTSTTWGRQMVASLAAWFGDLRDIAVEAFGGISDALASGDLQLAAKIAMAGVNLAWLRGTDSLQQQWIDFKDFYLRTTTELVFDSIRLWAQFKTGVMSIWAAMETSSKSVGETIGHHLSRSSDPELAAEQDREHNKALQRIKREGEARQREINNDEKAQLDQIEADRIAASEDRNRQFNKEVEQRQQALNQAKEELRTLREKARLELKERELSKGPDFDPAGVTGFNPAKLRSDISASFSLAALQGQVGGRDPAADAINKLRKENDRHHGRLLNAVRDDGLNQ